MAQEHSTLSILNLGDLSSKPNPRSNLCSKPNARSNLCSKPKPRSHKSCFQNNVLMPFTMTHRTLGIKCGPHYGNETLSNPIHLSNVVQLLRTATSSVLLVVIRFCRIEIFEAVQCIYGGDTHFAGWKRNGPSD